MFLSSIDGANMSYEIVHFELDAQRLQVLQLFVVM